MVPMQNTQQLLTQAYSLHHNGKFAEAEILYRQLLTAQPRQPDALHLLGLLCYQTNRTLDAIAWLEQAVSISPKNTDYLHNYGRALNAAGRSDEAIRSYQKALSLTPKDLDLQINMGNAYLQLGRFEEAAGYYRRLVKIRSLNADTKELVNNALCHAIEQLGNNAQAIGNYAQAEACYQEALQYSPRNAIYFYNLGNAQREMGKAAQAADSYAQSIKLDVTDADVYNNLGNVQRELGLLDKAIANYETALSLNPNLHHAKVHLVHQKQHICDWHQLSQDIDEIRDWVMNIPSAQISPFAFLAMPNTTAEEQQKCASNWVNNRFKTFIDIKKNMGFSDATSFDKQRSAKPTSKLKLGYFSADFRLHPLAFLISELIELHDRKKFEVIAYSYGVNDQSAPRKRLEKAFDVFYDVRSMSEIDIAKKINADGIDILIDLTGFTQNSRSGLLALRPAPIQVNWLGFPGTMGTDFYDYILTDGFISSVDESKHYTEKLALLPDCYQPNDRKRPIGTLTSRQDNQLPQGGFVFCCFNQSFKITPDIFAVWMRLLKAIPNSVLWLLDCNSWAKNNLIREASAYGIGADRLIFAPRTSITNHLARHPCADLFLDTLPYNAHTTASDALWMGLPLLTCVGNTFASRVAGSLLNAAQLPELITYSLSEYEEKAIELARHPETLIQLKNTLASEVKNSTLFDTEKLTRNLESTLINLTARPIK